MEDKNENNEKLIKILIWVVVWLLIVWWLTYFFIEQMDNSSDNTDYSLPDVSNLNDNLTGNINYSTPIDYDYSLSYLSENATLDIKTIHRNEQLQFQLYIAWFSNLKSSNRNQNIIIQFNDVNGFKVTSYDLKINNLIWIVWDDGIFTYDWEIYLNEDDYALISDVDIISTIQPDKTAVGQKENIDNSISDSIWREVLLRYYNNIWNWNLKEAYELSVKKSPYETFYGWFKDIEKAEINSIVPDPKKENWYLIDVNLIDVSWKSTNYSTNSRVWVDSSWVYRILETKIN